MKTRSVNVSTLKANLSKYLRLVRKGEHVLVMDRQEPVAELRPAPSDAADPWESLARKYPGFRRGTQDWETLKIAPKKEQVPILELLANVRKDRS